jgi:hypothetical protein
MAGTDPIGGVAGVGTRARRPAPRQHQQVVDATAFAGVWRAPHGSAWRFAPNETTRLAQSDAAPSPAATRASCSGVYRVAYEERGRDVLVESGLDASAHSATVWHSMPDRIRLPVASVACSEERWAGSFVLVRADELWLLEPWMTTDEIRADAFVFRRIPER